MSCVSSRHQAAGSRVLANSSSPRVESERQFIPSRPQTEGMISIDAFVTDALETDKPQGLTDPGVLYMVGATQFGRCALWCSSACTGTYHGPRGAHDHQGPRAPHRRFHEYLDELGVDHQWTVLPGIGHDPLAVLEAMGASNWAFHRKAFAGLDQVNEPE